MTKTHNIKYRTPLLFIIVILVAIPAGRNCAAFPRPAEYNYNRNYNSSKEPVSIFELLRESHLGGGLAVHVNCGTGLETATLTRSENLIIQGLSSDPDEIDQARQYARELDLDGRLSFRHWKDGKLPYNDNLVNILFCDKQDTGPGMDEIMRVLAPNGSAYIKKGNAWERVTKPWPDDIDQWPHYRYDAGSTGASKDERVGPPEHIQWEAGPRYMRSHEIETGLSSIISANGRLYYILDEGPTGITDARFPPKWSLVCRDAFNGIMLWKRPLPNWGWQAWAGERINDPIAWHGLRTRPGDVDRLMVADGDILYAALSYGASINAIDGVTGKILMTYPETEGADEFIIQNGLLLVRNDSPGPSITAIRINDGKMLWKREADIIMDRSLSAIDGQVFYHTRFEMVSVDLQTGNDIWKKETDMRPGAVIAHKDAVLAMQSGVTLALSAQTGDILWQGPGASTRGRYPDMFIVDDVVWSGRPNFEARNIKTGEILKKMELQKVLESGHHRRCFTDRATTNYMITGERGSEFLDLHKDEHKRHNWFRGPCVTGMVPANGLFYVPPHQCFCYPAIRMDGFFALSSGSGNQSHKEEDVIPSPRLEKGPAFGRLLKDHKTSADDWPAYRRDSKRSGSTNSQVPSDIEKIWTASIGGNLTQPVVAGEKVFVVQKDAATIHCLDLENGDIIWRKTVAGRIDSPPVIHNGNLLFGSRDGFVYSLCVSDGALAWRFRAAPEEKQIISYDRLESPWPVHGSVLLHNGLLYCSAGRSGFVDGGIYLYALDPEIGELVFQNKIEGPYPDISKPSYAFYKDGYRSDLFTTDGKYIYMGRTMLDRNLNVIEPERIPLIGTQRGDIKEIRKMPGMRLVATGSFLNHTFWNRTWWMYSYVWPSFHYAQQAPKSGQMLVFDDQNTYTVKHYFTRNRHSPMLFPGNGYLLFADDNNNEPLFYRGEGEPRPIEWEPEVPEETRWSIFQDASVDKGPGFTRSQPALWTSWVDVRIEAMVLAGDKLFFGGTPDLVPKEDPLAALEGRRGGVISIVSTRDGSQIKNYLLQSPPVFDGMVAARGRLFISTKDGEIICMGKTKSKINLSGLHN